MKVQCSDVTYLYLVFLYLSLLGDTCINSFKQIFQINIGISIFYVDIIVDTKLRLKLKCSSNFGVKQF